MSETDINRIKSGTSRLKQSLKVSVILILPALLLNFFISGYLEDKKKLKQISDISQARLEMARLQRLLDLKTVINSAINKQKNYAQNLIDENHNNLSILSKFSDSFYSVFPESSELIWLNKNFKIIENKKISTIRKKNAWQRFVKTIVKPDKVSQLSKKIADGLIKTTMSDFLSTSFFDQITNEPSEVLYQNNRAFFRLLHFPDTTRQAPSYLLLIIPLDQARKYWLESRAFKIINRSVAFAGGIIGSSNKLVEGSTISKEKLLQFRNKYQSGKEYIKQGNNYYYFSQHKSNPDIFICIASQASEASFLDNFLILLQKVVFIPVLLWLFFAWKGKADFRSKFNFSLKTRFKFATIFLTSLPILFMILMGLFVSGGLRVELDQQLINSLNKSIENFNESVTRQTVELETFLQSDLTHRLSRSTPNQRSADRAFNLLKSSGCHLAIIYTSDGKIFHAGNLPANQIKPRISIFLGLIKMPLEDAGFDMEKLRDNTRSSLQTNQKAYLQNKFRYDFFDRFNLIELGPTIAKLFSTFVYNSKGEITACVCLGFDSVLMQQYFLKNSLKLNNQPHQKVFIKPVSNQGTYFLPKSEQIKEFLDLTALTGETFVQRLIIKNKDYMLYSRMLKDIPTAATAVKELKQQEFSMQKTFILLMLVTFFLAFINARLILKLFETEFLTPVIDLASTAQKIKAGDFSIKLEPEGNNELAQLQKGFNKISVALREKAEMKNYLSKELIEQSSQDQQILVENLDATVMFCGIRNFTRIEQQLQPEESFEIMNTFLSVCDEQINKAGGETDKFIGETIMAFFKSENTSNQIENAINAALRIKMDLSNIINNLPEQNRFVFGVGIAQGPLIAGHIGSLKHRLDYTVIGDTVNLAARLEKLAGRDKDSQVLTTRQVIDKLENREYSIKHTGALKVKGKKLPVDVVEICRET
ncbi:MAG: adenylate/guanylate cyclase domain-containing protein [Candidatus Rifleibacteriota bacterium]